MTVLPRTISICTISRAGLAVTSSPGWSSRVSQEKRGAAVAAIEALHPSASLPNLTKVESAPVPKRKRSARH